MIGPHRAHGLPDDATPASASASTSASRPPAADRASPRGEPPESRRTPVAFGEKIPDEEWRVYEPLLRAVQAERIAFALGGGFAYSLYSGLWRNTKDIDLYVQPEDRQRVIDITKACGFADYFDEKPYDRSWIYRSHRDGVIGDIIWSMPNHRADVDARWMTHGQAIDMRGVQARAVPVEELIFAKLYVMQRERCDWPDLLSVMWAQAEQIDFDHLIDRVGADAGLLAALLRVFAWLCPGRAGKIEDRVWSQLGLVVSTAGPECATEEQRVRLLDTRRWFAPLELNRQREEQGKDAGR